MTKAADAKRIATNLTVGQWLVLEGPRKFGIPSRASDYAKGLYQLGLISHPAPPPAPNREWVNPWPLTELGKAVLAARNPTKRSAIAERAKRAYDRNCEKREKATVGELRKMTDPWDDAVSAIYTEIETIVRAHSPGSDKKVQDDV